MTTEMHVQTVLADITGISKIQPTKTHKFTLKDSHVEHLDMLHHGTEITVTKHTTHKQLAFN